MTDAETLLDCARSVMKQQTARRREVVQNMQGWRDLSCQLAEAAADLLESLDAFLQDGNLLDAEGAGYIRAVASSGWQRLVGTGVVVDGNEGDEFDASLHKAVAEGDMTEARPRILRTLQHGLILRGERVRRAEVVVSRRRSS